MKENDIFGKIIKPIIKGFCMFIFLKGVIGIDPNSAEFWIGILMLAIIAN